MFNILDHLDSLNHLGRGRYNCPVCDSKNFTISKKTGAYKCWANECDSVLIREAIAPTEAPAPKKKLPPKQKAKPVFIDETPTWRSLPGDRTYPKKGDTGRAYVCTYDYGDGHTVRRIDYFDRDARGEKIGDPYKKEIRPFAGEVMGKGDRPWDAYRLAEAIVASHGGSWVFAVEGEKCVEAMRWIGIPSITWQGGSWTDQDLSRAIVQLKASDCGGLIFIPDKDEPGQKKAEKVIEACAGHSFPCLVLDMLDLGADCPEKGDVADWIKAMEKGEQLPGEDYFYDEAIEMAIAAAIDRQDPPPAPKPDPTESDRPIEALTTTPLAPVSEYDETDLDFPEQLEPEEDQEPDLTFQEIARQWIYGKGHWIAINDELFHYNGRFYEKAHPAKEKKKIIAWASTYWVKDPKTKNKKYAYMNSASISKIWAWVIDYFAINPEQINPSGLNLKNGVLRIFWDGRSPKWALHPHTHKDFYLYSSEVEYNPEADAAQCDRLLACLDPAPRSALLRQLAASFDLEMVRRLHSRGIKAAIAKGTGANGKDSIRAAIAKIFCNQMTGLGLSEFQSYDNGRKFGLAPLENSLINWSSENNMGTTLDRVESLNICVTGEENGIWIERKGKDGYAITPRAIHIFNTNQIPKLKSGMDSLLSRFVVYNFNKTFKDNPNPARGELKADPRFHDDPQFLIKEVCPALINRLLVELGNLATEGIDYDSLKSGLDELQEESTHLWEFVGDLGIKEDPDGKIWVSDLWDKLRQWYIDTGALEIEEMDNGKTRNFWHDQANQYDRNITGANQVYKRFKLLFPKIKRDRETSDPFNKGRFYISGLSFNNSASLLHNAFIARDSASLAASLSFTNSFAASPEQRREENREKAGEAASEGKNEAASEGEMTLYQQSEAVKQKNQKLQNSETSPFLYKVGDLLLWKAVNRVVVIKGLPGPGVYYASRSYLCETEDEEEAWIKQTDLRPIE